MKKSMMETSKAQDKKDKRSSFNGRWSCEALLKHGCPATSKQMEAICFTIVNMVKKYHLGGPAFLNLYDQLHQDKADRNQDLIFKEHIQAVCTVLLVSKARVDTCLKHENLGSLVAFPLSMLETSIASRSYNNRRKAQNRRGKKAMEEDAEASAADNASSTTATGSDDTKATNTAETVSRDKVRGEIYCRTSVKR
ncbi:uncharacterized protein M421DRAFT_375205 [Didymella exigua CBS 183.55]|uniref:Uncharacterized protein n=1 Tax=Didymella exigua CBS 183.55 TaxID=1150837 RepID=A0A6A5RSZ5_9PLEO|nr:uncharacterized protein M421DRAFT_375205 [Didymella exigua CBS 183.55]KAF1930480.1 hypothetical protein M421DRAFT_375205 [Didymella exigua CBS 183.55]